MQGRDAVRRSRTLGTAHRAVPAEPKSRCDFRTARLASGPAITDRPTAGPNAYCGAQYSAPQPSLATAHRAVAVVLKSCCDFRTARLGPQRVEGAGLVGATVGVGAEEVTLALNQGGGQTVGTQAVVVGQ